MAIALALVPLVTACQQGVPSEDVEATVQAALTAAAPTSNIQATVDSAVATALAQQQAQPPSTSTATLRPPMPTPVPVPFTVTPEPAAGLSLYESEGGIPYEGANWAADVAPDEIEVLTGGPAKIAGISLPGGVDRGSVILLLPGDEVISYTVTELVTGANWHGSYRPIANPTAESTWRALANDRVAAMQQAPNCTPGTGCTTVDVLVIGPGPTVVTQWVQP